MMQVFKTLLLVISVSATNSFARADLELDNSGRLNKIDKDIKAAKKAITYFGKQEMKTLKRVAKWDSISLYAVVGRDQRKIYYSLLSIHESIIKLPENLYSSMFILSKQDIEREFNSLIDQAASTFLLDQHNKKFDFFGFSNLWEKNVFPAISPSNAYSLFFQTKDADSNLQNLKRLLFSSLLPLRFKVSDLEMHDEAIRNVQTPFGAEMLSLLFEHLPFLNDPGVYHTAALLTNATQVKEMKSRFIEKFRYLDILALKDQDKEGQNLGATNTECNDLLGSGPVATSEN